jgi:hypothetical protein
MLLKTCFVRILSIRVAEPLRVLGTLFSRSTSRSTSITNTLRAKPLRYYSNGSQSAGNEALNQRCICGLLICIRDVCPAERAGNWSSIHESRFLAPYQGSEWTAIDDMLAIAKAEPGSRLLDLGAGDGRILIRAIQFGCSYSEGWEFNRDVYDVAKRHVDSFLGLSKTTSTSCNIIFGDVIYSKPTQFDIVTMFLLPDGLKNIQSWLNSELSEYESVASLNSSVEELQEGDHDSNKNNKSNRKYVKFVTQGVFYVVNV